MTSSILWNKMMGQIVLDQAYFGYLVTTLFETFWLGQFTSLKNENCPWTTWSSDLTRMVYLPHPPWKLVLDKLDDRFSKSGFSLPPTNKNFPWTTSTNLAMMVYPTSAFHPQKSELLMDNLDFRFSKGSLPTSHFSFKQDNVQGHFESQIWGVSFLHFKIIYWSVFTKI